MARHLVIVESPAKVKTLGHLLGPDYLVRASLGRVREPPASRLGIDTRRGFALELEVPASRRRLLSELRAAARAAETVMLAADPDAEGEAVCWHLAEELRDSAGRGRPRRVELHELTPAAVAEALRMPRDLDARRVEAEQARQILDRLVGHGLSALVSRRLQPGLSAGRIPALALRLVCERERERTAFVPHEHWAVHARLDAGGPPPFAATLVTGSVAGQTTATRAEWLCGQLASSVFRVSGLRAGEIRRAAPPPFATSTLRREASRKLGFGVKKTMQLARRLYEGVALESDAPIGLLTYVNTDSLRVAPPAVAAARDQVSRLFGAEYLSATPNAFRSPIGAGARHGAIRPTDLTRTPDSLMGRLATSELALYRLVYDRFLASQMSAAVSDELLVEIEARPEAPAETPPQRLLAVGATPRFAGFLAAYDAPPDELCDPAAAAEAPAAAALPPLRLEQPLALLGAGTVRELTPPPPRFTEVSLLAELERLGVARPSTLAAVLPALRADGYVTMARGSLEPTTLGYAAADLLADAFPELSSPRHAATLEAELNAIEEGRQTLLGALMPFWRGFEAALRTAERAPRRAAAGRRFVAATGGAARARTTEGLCPDCGAPLARRIGRFSTFLSCSRFPACRHVAKPPARATGVTCPRCHEGAIVEREAEGREFYGCSRYPACRFTSRHRPLAESCPDCGRAYMFERQTTRGSRVVFCGAERCRFQRRE